MEETTAAELKPQVSNPPTTAQTLPSQPPPPPPSTVLPPPSKKRPLESDAHANYFKIRAVIRDLRLHFLEVLRTPDFRNCKAADEIREQLKILIELYKHMKEDVASLKKSRLQDVKQEQPQHLNSHEQSQMNKVSAKPPEIRLTPPVVSLEKQQTPDGQGRGSYVVGGSAFGWNFITYAGKESVYYGRTKEQFRAANT